MMSTIVFDENSFAIYKQRPQIPVISTNLYSETKILLKPIRALSNKRQEALSPEHTQNKVSKPYTYDKVIQKHL